MFKSISEICSSTVGGRCYCFEKGWIYMSLT